MWQSWSGGCPTLPSYSLIPSGKSQPRSCLDSMGSIQTLRTFTPVGILDEYLTTSWGSHLFDCIFRPLALNILTFIDLLSGPF